MDATGRKSTVAHKTLLEGSGLWKTYSGNEGAEPVLSNVSLQVERGEFVSLVGPSGCGKSTLLHVLGGFARPDRGEVRLGGAPLAGPASRAVMLFQEYGLLPWRSALGNVELGLEPLGMSVSDRRERARYYLQLVQLDDKRALLPHQLSGGMKQRVALARALAVRPELLLMDEPFAALDTFTRYHLQDQLLELQRKEALTVVLVTHDIDEAVYLSDRVLLMEGGPGRIHTELAIALAKPRDRGQRDFQAYRKRILEAFRLTGNGPEEEFTI
ncbi:ABC transporter ATP-binding protein [Paenibacillus sp. IB182496]|uniref:ABC transporter ATP-binding protein n=1 Tax=Paenibacillus sabuli TaxID=2772509 RepID=A0A927BPD0_9BACL|nr:ABC transporter ATP-binding protein [Paenibacillus sabuli]MBD2844273.1 ABC transporter ATP-binding protein [Paenibacillus sabuli]